MSLKNDWKAARESLLERKKPLLNTLPPVNS